MRRIFSVIAVAALMAAMLAVTAMPAFAQLNCAAAQHKVHENFEDKFWATGDQKYADQVDKHIAMENDGCDQGVPPGHAKP
jgi:multidrug efflux pump subunit AcrB